MKEFIESQNFLWSKIKLKRKERQTRIKFDCLIPKQVSYMKKKYEIFMTLIIFKTLFQILNFLHLFIINLIEKMKANLFLLMVILTILKMGLGDNQTLSNQQSQPAYSSQVSDFQNRERCPINYFFFKELAGKCFQCPNIWVLKQICGKDSVFGSEEKNPYLRSQSIENQANIGQNEEQIQSNQNQILDDTSSTSIPIQQTNDCTFRELCRSCLKDVSSQNVKCGSISAQLQQFKNEGGFGFLSPIKEQEMMERFKSFDIEIKESN